MGVLNDLQAALIAKAEAAFSLNCIQGYPNWNRSDLEPPLMACWWENADPIENKRLGKGVEAFSEDFILAIFANSYPQRKQYVETLEAMLVGWTVADIGSKRYTIRCDSLRAAPPDTDFREKTRYNVVTTITFIPQRGRS